MDARLSHRSYQGNEGRLSRQLADKLSRQHVFDASLFGCLVRGDRISFLGPGPGQGGGRSAQEHCARRARQATTVVNEVIL